MFSHDHDPSFASRLWQSRFAVEEIAEKVESVTEDYGKLEKEIEKASPLAIINKDLQKFGNGSAISFSGAKDVSLMLPFGVFNLDTQRLNSETYKLLDGVEKHCGIHNEYMHQSECCQVPEVRPLRRALEGWITGQRKDQSRGTRANVPFVQIDPSFEGLGGGIISLVKWNPVSNLGGQAIWNFLQTMDVPVNSLLAPGYVFTGCEPCTRPALPQPHVREGRCRWWEEGKVKKCVPHNGNIESEDAQLSEHINGVASNTNGSDPIADLFNSRNFISSSSAGIDIFATFENRTEPPLDVPWLGFCQAMEDLYVNLEAKPVDAKEKVGKFRVDGEHKAFAKQKLQLRSFTTTPIFPTFKPIKCSSEKRMSIHRWRLSIHFNGDEHAQTHTYPLAKN